MSAVALSDAQRTFYDENGYLVVPQLFASEDLDVWKRRLAAIVNGEVVYQDGALTGVIAGDALEFTRSR